MLHEIWLAQYVSWANQILCNLLIPHLTVIGAYKQGVTLIIRKEMSNLPNPVPEVTPLCMI